MSDDDTQNSRKTTAYILLSVAAFIILSRTGLFDLLGISSLLGWSFRAVRSLIPAAILLLGIYWLTHDEGNEKPIIAWALTLFGGVLLSSQFGLFGLSFGDLFLPMWLVIVAFIVMNPRNLLPRRFNTQSDEIGVGEDSDKLQLVAFMGGSELEYTSQSLTGGEVISVWGGYKLDFSQADMKDDSMTLNLFCVMGGVEVVVPLNWAVEKRGAVCIMGGFTVKSKCLAEELELPRKTLIIKGLALMGGGEIRN
ncbi:MAG: hypothetical protein COA96_03115 [SAR86 cluster bacterium]|uniref:Uncharacterized protein n=1 Tax=SAR86 cluster bacterium TaxID=2030880 RepID=A0A2A5B7E9_9GAMM|nr:MAG: hypothetical protein COA96_03115 [SAR86 cluster bacterium]